MKNYHFLVYGEDERQQYLKEILEEKGYVVKDAKDASAGFFEAILLPLSETEMYLKKYADSFCPGQFVFGCNFPEETVEFAKNKKLRFVDYMKEDGVAEKNAVAVAEGILSEAIAGMKQNLCDSHCLVYGYGRCGSAVAELLLALKARVTVVEKDSARRKLAEVAGYSIKSNGNLSDYELIVNTVPKLVLNREILKSCRKDVLILDLASKPGGVDFAFCKDQGIRAKLCPGLPARYAPKTSAEILVEVIEKKLENPNEGEQNK